MSRIPFENDENKNPDTMSVFRSHPEKPEVMQKFLVKIKKGKRKQKALDEAVLVGDYRKAKDGEEPDCQIFSPIDFELMPYVKIEKD